SDLDRLQSWRDDLVFEQFPWGEYWGAELNPRFAAIPGYDEQAGPEVLGGSAGGADTTSDPAVALWALLYDDPAAELRLMAAGSQRAPGARQSDASVALARATHLLAAQEPPPPLADLLAEGGIAGVFAAALRRAIALFDSADPQLQTALRAIPDAQLADYRSALARAIVADAMGVAQAAGGYPELFVDAELRDRTVDELEQALDGGTVLGGAADWLSFLPASALTELVLRPYRAGLTKLTLAFFGDIVAYQAKRELIQTAIAKRLGDGPTVLLAHSLGGIACVDLLLSSEAARAQVPLLITAGSQAAMLHEIGALGRLGPAGAEPTPLAPDFPPWLNLYDRSDMLGFRAAPIFAGVVRDVELSGGQPFPHAHNAYWRNGQLWEQIFAAIADPGNVLYQLR
ncbi:MAG: hypothetical protein HGA45_01700, partial [Chloroflexales bacterium]|nr:hypothetical protein [Chloroflexales bacterium]